MTTTRRTIPLAPALLAMAFGCASESTPLADARRSDTPLGDASTEGCEPLEIGLCAVPGSGASCTGAADEGGVFSSADDGDPATLVLGPQGSRMLVLAARTRGIEPGDPARPASPSNPIVEMVLTDDAGHEVTSYRGRTAFAPDAEDPEFLVQPALFVIMEGALPAEIHVLATLRDRVGAERCGTLRLAIPR